MEEKKIIVVLERIESRLTNLEEGQKKLETGVKGLEGSVKTLEEGQKKLETGVKGLEGSVKTLEEGQKAIRARLDATFERTGKNVEEIIIIRKQLETIQEDIRLIKHNLKTKADLEELQVLENRITLIERRLLKLTHR